MICFRGVSVAGFAVLALSVADATVLYDATGGLKPNQAPWTWSLQGAGATVTGPVAGSTFTHFDSTVSNAAQEGWLQFAPTALDNSVGYDVTFDLRIDSESHATNDRAGISIIVLGQDHKGIELSFWNNKVWTQNDSPLFTQGEGAAFDTTASGTGIGGLRHYTLHVVGGNYSLVGEGGTLFGGAVRDYSAFTGSPNPYGLPNFLWVGDDTTSASASADFSSFSVTPIATPEPATLAALALGAFMIRKRRRISS